MKTGVMVTLCPSVGMFLRFSLFGYFIFVLVYGYYIFVLSNLASLTLLLTLLFVNEDINIVWAGRYIARNCCHGTFLPDLHGHVIGKACRHVIKD